MNLESAMLAQTRENGKCLVVDFELCVGGQELKETIALINNAGYHFIAATQEGDTYTVFFRRPMNG